MAGTPHGYALIRPLVGRAARESHTTLDRIIMNSIEILERLVGFPTVSGTSNLPLIDFVRTFLAERRISSRLIGDESGQKANLLATIGTGTRGGIILSGHTDVVPVKGQMWHSNPFRLTERDGKLFGRGTADMKGFLACALRAAGLASRIPLRRPLHLAFSYDEEIGCVGVRPMLEDMRRLGFEAELCIVGEPTSMIVATGHKGKIALDVQCRARAAHSASAPMSVSAIHLAIDLVQRLRHRQQEMASAGPQDTAYDIPYATIHVGTIHGGIALNVVPAHCTIEVEIRHPYCAGPDEIVAFIEREAAAIASAARVRCPEAGITVTRINAYPALDTAPQAEAVRTAHQLAGTSASTKVSFGSEAGLYREHLGVPAVICGPGSIDRAHQPDEYLELDQLERCDRMMDALLEHLID